MFNSFDHNFKNIPLYNEKGIIRKVLYDGALTLKMALNSFCDKSLHFFKSLCNIWVSVTPSHNSFTISPHNLALLHSTLLHSYPVPLSLSMRIVHKRDSSVRNAH